MSTTPHPFAPEEIMAHLDGELSAERAQVVSAHIQSCSECGSLSQEFQRAKFNVAMWQVAALPEATENRIHAAAAKLHQPSQPSSPRVFQRMSFWSWKQWLGAASATAALAVLVLAISFSKLQPSPSATMNGTLWMEQRPKTRSVDRAVAASPESLSTAEFGKQLEKTTDDLAMSTRDGLSFKSLGPAGGGSGVKARTSAPRGMLPELQTLVPSAPMIARSVSLALIAKDFDSSRTSLDSILVRYHGYAANLSSSTPQGAARSTEASLRVPAPQLSAALAELKSLGHVENENQNGEEVTQQHADLVARLKNSRETEQRLQAILTQRTGKISDVLEVEQEIARVRGEIEQMEAEQKNLEHRVDFATVDLKISEEYKAKLDSPAPSISTRLHNALVNGYRNVSDTLVALLLFFAEFGPILLFWALLLSIPVWLLWRRHRHAVAF